MFNSMKKNSMKQLVFLTMLFGLMIVLNGSASAQQNCGEPGDNEVIIYEHIFSQAGGGICKKLSVGEYKDAAAMGLADLLLSTFTTFTDETLSFLIVGLFVKSASCLSNNSHAPVKSFPSHTSA